MHAVRLAVTLIIGGTVLLFIGLERYIGKAGRQWHNYLYLAVFFLVQMFFVYVRPSLLARNINISVGLLLICTQCAWLLLRRVGPAMRPDTRAAGIAFGIFSLVSLARIFLDLAVPPEIDFLKSGLYDSLVILTYQMLYIWLTFALFLMVDRRLLTALENDITEKELVEAALKVSEEKFSIAFQNIPDAIVITSLPDGKIFEANASFFRLSEYSKEESLGRTTVELKLWGSLTHRNEMVAALQKKGRVLNLETDFRKKSGKLFSGLISSEVIELRGQKYVLNVIHNLTERKQAEELLQSSEKRFHALFDQAAVGVALLDTKTGRYIDINQSYCDFLGYTKEEMLNLSFQDVTYPDNIQENIDDNAKLLNDEIRQFTIEKRYIHKDGKIVWGELTASPLWMSGEEATEYLHIAVVQDITERKRAEAALQESEERFRSLYENVPTGIYRTSPNGHILMANPALLRMLGYESFEELSQRNLVSEGNGPKYLREEFRNRIDRGGEVRGLKSLWKCRDGSFINVRESAHLVKNENYQPLYYEGTVEDISDRIRAEEALRKSASSLQAVLHSTADGILAVGIENDVLYVNERFAELWQIPPEVLASKNNSILLRHVLDQLSEPQSFLEMVQELYKSNKESFDILNFKDGRVFERLSRPLMEGEAMMGRVWSFRDITERMRLEEEIRSLSLTDELTGLYNRRGFTILAEQELKQAHREKRTMLLFFGDIDNLKAINDTWGHAQGDLALRELSTILKEIFRESDILARVGGDEFVVVALDASREGTEIVTNRIQSALEARNQQKGATYQLALSLGIARFDPEMPCTLSELIAQADGLMYQQKQARKKKK